MDHYSPKETAHKVIEKYSAKLETNTLSLIVLGMLGGAYIAMGSTLYIVVTQDMAHYFGKGFTSLIGGLVFSVGLVMIVFAGAELFTGNCLIIKPVLHKRASLQALLKNWFFVYVTNLVGALAFVIIIHYSGILSGDSAKMAMKIAEKKLSHSFSEAFFRALICNWLVCLAIWLSTAAKTFVAKVLAILIPVTTFVAIGCEHIVANMFFVPMAIVINMAHGHSALLSVGSFLRNNALPVTLGNIVGGVLLVGVVYYLTYIFKKEE